MSARLGVGTASFLPAYGLPGTPVSTATVDMLDAVLATEIGYLDTAAAYGEAEVVLGTRRAVIDTRGIRLATKVAVGRSPAVDDAEGIVAAVRASVARLGGPSVDTLLWHSVSAEQLGHPLLGEVARRLVDEGLVGRVGASTYGSEAARVALTQPWCRALQIEYSALNQSVWQTVCQRRRPDQEIVVRSVLCKGLLTARWREVPALAEPLRPRLLALEGLAAEWGLSLAALAMRFALDTSGVDVVLVGVGARPELDEAVWAAAAPALSAGQWAQVAALDASDHDVTHPERWTHV